jgi:type II secretory pathway component GspD/PulD (secretin)
MSRRRWWGVLACLWVARGAAAQDTVQVVGDSVVVRFAEADLRAVLQGLGRYLDRPLLVGSVPGVRITFESPAPLPRSGLPDLLRGLAEAHGLELLVDSAFYRIAQSSESVRRSAGPPGVGGEGAAGPAELFVLRLKHARASDVAGTVGALFGIAAGSGGGRQLSTGTLSDELRRTAAATTAVPPAAGPSGGAGRGATLEGAVTIVPDELTNSLLIRASATDHALIAQAVQHLDLRPLQVLIQVLIVEARKDRLFALGVEATASGTFDQGRGAYSGTLVGGGLGTFVLEVMHMASLDLDVVLRAAVSRGDAKIVSRPVLLASNNREARILVGSQRPFVQVSRSLPTDTPTRDQVVQYKDVGTKLTVLPTINPDGYVNLLIRQEVNSATAEVQFDAPVIATRETETDVLVKDGQTVVLGGLREQLHEVVKSGIPVLTDLPILGGLFGVQQRRTTETELFLFITPIVLRDDASADSAAADALGRADRVGDVGKERRP